MDEGKLVKLYENCIITKGISRSLIADVQRNNYFLIPNSLAKLFNEAHILIIKEKSNKEIIEEYLLFLFENELCFWCENDLVDNFPVIEKNWDYPARITNVIVETNLQKIYETICLLNQITEELLTLHVEIIFQNENPLDVFELNKVLLEFDSLDLYNYNVTFSLKNNASIQDAISIIKEHYKIFRTIICNATKDEIFESDKQGWGNIFVIQDAYNHKYCGMVETYYFSNNLSHIIESYQHNTCLNRKLAIDIEGNIKNCPSIAKSYGNIKDTKLIDVVNNPEFQKLWYIHKDQISVCKDCEFRHICTDCRAYLENPDDIYSKPLKCGYNPYTCEWEEWSTNPLKQQAIDYYEMREIINK